jgi:hypothetical protein
MKEIKESIGKNRKWRGDGKGRRKPPGGTGERSKQGAEPFIKHNLKIQSIVHTITYPSCLKYFSATVRKV